jgi:predicted RNA binding protein YcfA (HicA-like mRNA interferase family)
MPKKVRELKAMLRKAGFFVKPGKGSHTVWGHPALTAKLRSLVVTVMMLIATRKRMYGRFSES